MPKIFAVFLLPLMAIAFAMPVFGAAEPSFAQANFVQPRSAVSDAQLEATIRAKLAKSKIGKDGFRFHVQHGVVTWEGNTSVAQHKGAATRMARSSGAVQVVNHIKVSGAGTGTALRKAYVQP
jgi:osmotically-inducible protein OsmY